MSVDKVDVRAKLAEFSDHWNPRVAGELNGQHVRLAKFEGEFVWHSHVEEDEMFLVIEGEFEMQFRDGPITVGEGKFIIVPRGVEHRPRALSAEPVVVMVEPAGTLNTGDAVSALTVAAPKRLLAEG